ncbi:unnamed protein product [Arctia plantaginis]|uniref:Uncharacterized protein n=1 Tax=Arctia plantaginis TaxID=874455 RepID=A0A8S0Z4R9_ARCPL|nr:unnamed protein product [Arctia plantaginis]
MEDKSRHKSARPRRRRVVAACANNDKSQLDRAPAHPSFPPHSAPAAYAPITMLMFCSIDGTRFACALFYAHFSTILYRIVP